MSLGSKPGRQSLALLVCSIAVVFAGAVCVLAAGSGSPQPAVFVTSPCKAERGLCMPAIPVDSTY
jgi:hypothetical protein